MVEFNKCLNCGGEISAGEEKCPVCGAVSPNGAAGQAAFAGEEGGASGPQPSPHAKKSAFATAPQKKNTGYGYEPGAKAPLSSGTVTIIVILAVVGLVVAFVASCFGAFLTCARILDGMRGSQNEIGKMFIVYCGIAFVTASSFTGLAIGYNAGAYMCMSLKLTYRELKSVSIVAIIFYYIGAFAGATAVTLLAMPGGERLVNSHLIFYSNIILSIVICGLITRQNFSLKSKGL